MKENENITIMRYEIMAAAMSQQMPMLQIRSSLMKAGLLPNEKFISLKNLLKWYHRTEEQILYERANKRNLISKCQFYSQK